MSLLDIIKNLFCGKSSEQAAPEQAQQQEVTAKTEEKPAPVEINSEPKPAPVVSTAKKHPTEEKIPEDSTLRRHYLANLEAQKQAPVVEVVEAAPIIEEKPEPVAVVADVVETAVEESAVKLQIPQDSTLKRHFIATLKAEIEAGMPARPTDAASRNKYDATVQAKLEKLLAE